MKGEKIMSSFTENCTCANCGNENLQLTTESFPVSHTYGECEKCGFHFETKFSFLKLPKLNELREFFALNPLKKLPKQRKSLLYLGEFKGNFARVSFHINPKKSYFNKNGIMIDTLDIKSKFYRAQVKIHNISIVGFDSGYFKISFYLELEEGVVIDNLDIENRFPGLKLINLEIDNEANIKNIDWKSSENRTNKIEQEDK